MILGKRYWTYTKYPFGESWESNFPDTIYLVGCKPPWSISLYCVDETEHKVVYHRGLCSTTSPGGSYIYSWDRKTLCPWTDTSFCGDIEEPPDPGNVVDGVGNSKFDLCVSYQSELSTPYVGSGLPGLSGWKEPRWVMVDGVCVPGSYGSTGSFSGLTNGRLGSAGSYTMTSGTYSDYYCSFEIDVDAGTCHAAMYYVMVFSQSGWTADYTFTGDGAFAFDPEAGGAGEMEVEGYVWCWGWSGGGCEYCDGSDSGDCGGHDDCLIGNIGITLTVAEIGKCS